MKLSPAFTDLFLRKLALPASGRVEHYDGERPGFRGRVIATGTKTFFVVYHHQGAFRRMSLGRYPVLTLQTARQQAQQALATVTAGADPQAPRRAQIARRTDLFPQVGIASLLETCKLNRVDPLAWTTDVLTKLVNRWPASTWGGWPAYLGAR